MQPATGFLVVRTRGKKNGLERDNYIKIGMILPSLSCKYETQTLNFLPVYTVDPAGKTHFFVSDNQ